MVKAIISDFDGVIRHWHNDKTEAVEKTCGLPAGTLHSVAFQPELLLPAIRGDITFEQWQWATKDKVEQLYGLMIAENFILAWRENGFTIDHALLKQYRSLFPQAQLVLATNATSRLPMELKSAELEYAFDQVFNSSAMGVVKPERGFYLSMLISLGLRPNEVVFIDDSLGNCEAAAQAGMPTIHFANSQQCVDSLIQIRGAEHFRQPAFRV